MNLSKIVKIFFVILILVSGAVGSYFIIKNSAVSSSATSNSTNEISEKISQSIQELKNLPIQWSENNENNSSNNLTQNIGQDVFEQIKGIDFSKQNSASLPANFDLMTAGLTKEALQKQLADFNLISDISDSELKIYQDNSKEEKTKYLDTIGKINKKDLGDFNKNYLLIIVDVFQKLDVSSANQIADIYKNLAADYINTLVPSDWLETHKKIIIHFKNSETIYRAMASYLTDPIKGYLALEVIQDSVNNGEQVNLLLQKEVNELK